MLAARLLAPSALQRFDQPKTVSYTADIAVHGRWLLPRDMMGNPATKPPLVNWLAAPLLAAGFWTELSVKTPMLLGSLATLALTVWMARRLLRRSLDPDDESKGGPDAGHASARGDQGMRGASINAQLATDAAFLAGIAWLVNPANLTMLYHCRPDPLLVTFLTGAWILGTRIVCDGAGTEPLRPLPRRIVLGFWVCVGLAALTKGPAALVPTLYLPLAARIIGGRWSLVHRSRWWWGVPLAVGMFLAWAVPCAIFYPEPFWKVLVGQELLAQATGMGEQFGNKRITSEGPIVALKLIAENPVWFVEKFAPWSAAAIGGLLVLGWRRWFRHPLAPAILWSFLVIVFFALSAHKTADYLLPSYPAAAVVAAYFCVAFLRRRLRVQPWQVGAAGLLVAVGLGVDTMFFARAARDGGGENLKAFAREARGIVGDEPVVFWRTGYNTLGFFLRRHQPGEPTPVEIERASWVIMPEQPAIPAEAVSEPITTKASGKRFTLGLYPAEAVRARLD